jgi:hypothetical protein
MENPMPQAVDDDITTITQKNPDVALMKLIEKYDRLSSEAAALDGYAVEARRVGDDFARADELAKRSDDACNRAWGLLWELIHRAAHTPQGHAAKVRMVAGNDFDPEDQVRIAWMLGHEAGRLGLSGAMPRLAPPAVPRMADAAE